jgi:prepilin-type N-terminal cleavage/methylation domain-containing protein
MKIAIFTRDMTAPNERNRRAFTLIELLVVIGIIAVVAGLVVGGAALAGDKKRISRAQTERDRLVTLIESYKAKVGVYPPDNTNNPGRNTLLYELAGAIRDTNNTASNPNYLTPFNNVQANVLSTECNVGGIQNSGDILGETSQVQRLLKDVRPDQVAQVGGIRSLVVPIDGPNGQPNAWNYLVGDHAKRNKDSFDLWVEIKVRGQTRTIGNWRD